MTAKVDSLDITVLEGGAVAVGNWAREHGFFLPPDAPEVLDFYAQRSPIFMATRFNAKRAAAQGLAQGEGTPGARRDPDAQPVGAAADPVARALAPGPDPGRRVPADRSRARDAAPGARAQRQPGSTGASCRSAASRPRRACMNDLRSDDRSKWIPDGPMWFTYLRIDAPASTITHDLAIDASGFGHPDPIAAGYAPASLPVPDPNAARSRSGWARGWRWSRFRPPSDPAGGRRDEARGGGRGGVCNVAPGRGVHGRRDRHPGPRAHGDDDDPLLALRPGFPAGRRPARPCGSSWSTPTRSITSSWWAMPRCRPSTRRGPRRTTAPAPARSRCPAGATVETTFTFPDRAGARVGVRLPPAGALRLRDARADRARLNAGGRDTVRRL